MKKLKLNVELLRVQSFDTGPGMSLHDVATFESGHSGCVNGCGGVEAFGDTDDCASKKADTMCEPPPSGQQACLADSTRPSACCGTGCTDHPC